MTLPPPPPPLQAVHEPERDDREPKTRMKMMLGDRIKVLVLITLFIVLSAAYLHSSIPIMSFWEALQDQLRAKWWLVGLFGLEVLRQLHYLICERVAGYNQFWEKQVWGGWERRMDKAQPVAALPAQPDVQVDRLHDHRRADPGLEVGHHVHRRPSSRPRPGSSTSCSEPDRPALPLFCMLIITVHVRPVQPR